MIQSTPAIHIIRPLRGWGSLDLRELWQFRELVFFLAWRDVKVRYKQTTIGIAWAVLQPVAMMAVFSIFFGRLAKMPSEGVPYPLFVLCGIVPWSVFSRSLTESTQSLITDQRLISRVYFPRIIVPMAVNIAAIVDFAIALGLFLGIMAWFGIVPPINILYLPLFVILLFITSMGVSFWLSALNVEYRDVMYVVPFLVQIWLFVTPVVYPTSLVPERYQFLVGLNPMAGVVEGFRWCLLGVGPGPSLFLAVSSSISLFLFVTGWVWFRTRERGFIDAIGSGGR